VRPHDNFLGHCYPSFEDDLISISGSVICVAQCGVHVYICLCAHLLLLSLIPSNRPHESIMVEIS